MSNEQIPKKIHLIWFGDKSKFTFDLDSLKKYAPNYEVKVWGEEDFDWDELDKIKYVRKTRKEKQWAFLSDYLRAKILFEEGGVYLDADVEVVQNIERLFAYDNLVLAFENTSTLSMGICASSKGNDFFKELMRIYESYKSGKNILGNVLWDYVAKRDLNIRINGRQQQGDCFKIHAFRDVSLLHPRWRKWKRSSQYTLHKHQVSWVPKWSRKYFKILIAISQKVTFINRIYLLLLIWPKKQMKKNFDID